MDSYSKTYGYNATYKKDVVFELDENIIDGLKKLKSSANKKDNFVSMLKGETKVSVGYSELSTENNKFGYSDRVTIKSIPYGLKDLGQPLMFVDGYIISSRVLNDPEKLEGIKVFIDYISNPSTISWISLGEDDKDEVNESECRNGNKVRYLLPAKNLNITEGRSYSPFTKGVYEQCKKTQDIAFPIPTNGVSVYKAAVKKSRLNE